MGTLRIDPMRHRNLILANATAPVVNPIRMAANAVMFRATAKPAVVETPEARKKRLKAEANRRYYRAKKAMAKIEAKLAGDESEMSPADA